MASADAKEIEWGRLLDRALTVPGNLNGVYSRFYPYSFLNCMLLLDQGVMEPVATYKRWASMGRYVLKGSKAKSIIRPIFVDKKDDLTGEVTGKITRFKLVKCLFGLSDTGGPELPAVEVPGWDLEQALNSLEIRRVPFDVMDGNVQGVSYERNLAVNPVAAHPFKTTIHEVGHIVLGHTAADRAAEYQQHRGLFEFGAEATSHLVCNELGQQTDEQASSSRAYLQSWLQGQRPSDSAIRDVFKATDTILRAGRDPLTEVLDE